MVRAFIMVEAGPGHAEELAEGIRDLAQVLEAHVVAGEFDIIVEAEGEEVYDVIHEVSTGIRGLEGTVDTKTYVCLE